MSETKICKTDKKVCDQSGVEVPFSGVGRTQEGWFRVRKLELYHRPLGFTSKKLPEECIVRIEEQADALDFSSARALAQYFRDLAEDLESDNAD